MMYNAVTGFITSIMWMLVGDCGVTRCPLVSKAELFRQSDIVTVHLVLSNQTRGLVGPAEFQSMKQSARFVNTARGPIIQEEALVEAVREGRIAGAAIDVFHVDLPQDHPFRRLENVVATPHIGYMSRELCRTFYEGTVENIAKWLGKRS